MRRFLTPYFVLAGACDATTGLLLVAAPAFTLGLMGIAVPAELVFLRWIGVFVGSVGLLYLYPLLLPDDGGQRRHLERCRSILEATALVRFAVAAFVLVNVVLGALALAWISVFFTDLTLAVVQLVLLRRWVTEDAGPG